MNYLNSVTATLFPQIDPALVNFFLFLFALLLIWSCIWKGIALWHAARNRQKGWFIILLILNTAGILDILYIYFLRKNKNNVIKTTTVTHTVTASTPSPEGAVPPSMPVV